MQERINLFDPKVRADPFPSYAPGGFWAVSRAEDVEYVLKHPKLFSSGFRAWEICGSIRSTTR